MAIVELRDVCKAYEGGAGFAVKDVNLRVEDGEFMILLGPSGCGKSTTLRMIAGLEPITSGSLLIDGRVVNDMPAKDRDIAMVFQSYALYPHMTVRQNLAFGLHRRGASKQETDRRVMKAAQTLELASLLDRKPAALSGGQRQRVALGRAMVRNPKVFLFDEPLSNLDAALRSSTRSELVRHHQALGATMIYVTHDQTEAMTMGQRICIINRGEIEQVGRPLDVYRNPRNTFVASFLGSPPMNLFAGNVKNEVVPTVGLGDVRLPIVKYSPQAISAKTAIVGVRPEDIYLGNETIPSGARPHKVSVVVEAVEALGAETIVHVRVSGERPVRLSARVGRSAVPRIGESIDLLIDLHAIFLFHPDSGLALDAGRVN